MVVKKRIDDFNIPFEVSVRVNAPLSQRVRRVINWCPSCAPALSIYAAV